MEAEQLAVVTAGILHTAVAAAEPAASSLSRQVFNCVGVTPSSAATLLCVAPDSDSRATDCSLYSGLRFFEPGAP